MLCDCSNGNMNKCVKKWAHINRNRPLFSLQFQFSLCRLRLKCDDTNAETRFRLSAKRTSPFKSAGASVHSTTGSRGGVRISGSNAGYTMFPGSVKGAGYPLHSPLSPSRLLPCVTVCHHISTGLYHPLWPDPTPRCTHRVWACCGLRGSCKTDWCL